MALGICWVPGWLFCGADQMIYVLRFMPDVYSLPFLKNQDTKGEPGGQEGLHVRGHILYMLFWTVFVLKDVSLRKQSSYLTTRLV